MCTWLTSELCPGAEAFTVAPPLAAAAAVAVPPVALVPEEEVLTVWLLAAGPPAALVEAAVEEDCRGEVGATAACSGAFFGLAAAALMSAIALCTCGPYAERGY